MKVAFWILRILITILVLPIYFIVSLLLTGIGIINRVISVVTALAGFIFIIVGLFMLIKDGWNITDLMIVVVGVLCYLIPGLIQAALEIVQEICNKILEFISGMTEAET